MSDSATPDLYVEGVQIGMSPFGVVFQFTKQPANQNGTQAPLQVCTLRMSAEHAKVMAILLRKNVKAYEQSMGVDVPLHPQVLQQLGLSRKEDW